MPIVQSVRWTRPGSADETCTFTIIDQRELPARFVERQILTLMDVIDAICTLAVRGAPAIGIAGAMGLVVATQADGDDREAFLSRLHAHAHAIRATRPTAVNLPWALARILRVAESTAGDATAIHMRMYEEATAILDEDRAMCQAIGEYGASLVSPNARIATHCNTGALATGGIGTALAAVYVASQRGLNPSVYADETRPLLQGSRLTAWELKQAGIPVTILADGAMASLMAAGRIDLVIVGADRITANGDFANKVGTYPLALAAKYHGIPFYVAAPSTSIDVATRSGADIHIEQRDADEVRRVAGQIVAPDDVDVYNPAFDVTPASLVSAFVTDRGIHRPPFNFSDAIRPRD